jgi:hypothetical protein
MVGAPLVRYNRHMRILTPLVVAAVLAVGADIVSQGAPAQPIPDWVRAQWALHAGTWITDNTPHRSESEPFDQYGLEWTWGLGQHSLIGRLYGLTNGKDVATFWQFRQFWHPGEGQLTVEQFGTDGTYGVGPNVGQADGSFEMLQVFYSPTAGTRARVGHQASMKDGRHVTASFDVGEDGAWVPRRSYVWIKQAPASLGVGTEHSPGDSLKARVAAQ